MGWANVRRTVVVDVGPDPRQNVVLGLGAAILRRTQGQGLRVVGPFEGSPETTYGGSYAPRVQADVTGAAASVRNSNITRDLGGQDISSAVTATSSSASRTFAERLRRGRSVT